MNFSGNKLKFFIDLNQGFDNLHTIDLSKNQLDHIP